MSDPLRTDPEQPPSEADGLERDAKIESLLLSGLDHYFATRYELAVNIWTRVLFLDRSHTRARAYIERARSALAEQFRESEQMLHEGIAAFERGESETARRLLDSVIEQSGPNEVALALLGRLNRLDSGPADEMRLPLPSPATHVVTTRPQAGRRGRPWMTGIAVVVALIGVGAAVSTRWALVSPWVGATLRSAPPAAANRVSDEPLPTAWPSDVLLAQARVLAAGGHLSDALRLVDQIRATDPARPDATRLKIELQRRLLSTIRVDPREPDAAAPAAPSKPE